MNKFKLYLDTSDRKKITVRLFKNSKILSEKVNVRLFSSQILLEMIEKICLECNLNPHDITEIEIALGPGSYTGLKVGAAVANAFGWLLNIPVNGEKGKILEPVFG